MKKHRDKIIIGAVIAAVLAFVFWYGGDSPTLRGWKSQPKNSEAVVQNNISARTETSVPDAEPAGTDETEQMLGEIPIKEADEPDAAEDKTRNTNESLIAAQNEISEVSPSSAEIINEDPPEEKDEYQTEPVPTEPQDSVISDKALTCTLSVRCDSVFDNMDWLDAEKAELVPKDGIIYAEKTVAFYEGESVFDLLLREMKQNKIHIEYENTPVYNSAYIEGIANLYEFDCGELSGWMYKVNGSFPKYSCSRCLLSAGDRVEWVYTCDLGNDVGNGI